MFFELSRQIAQDIPVLNSLIIHCRFERVRLGNTTCFLALLGHIIIIPFLLYLRSHRCFIYSKHVIEGKRA